MRFTHQETKNGSIVFNNNEPLKNHLGNALNGISTFEADLLAADLNEIFDAGRTDLTKSFVYCVCLK